jgi:hypothetical protein
MTFVNCLGTGFVIVLFHVSSCSATGNPTEITTAADFSLVNHPHDGKPS